MTSNFDNFDSLIISQVDCVSIHCTAFRKSSFSTINFIWPTKYLLEYQSLETFYEEEISLKRGRCLEDLEARTIEQLQRDGDIGVAHVKMRSAGDLTEESRRGIRDARTHRKKTRIRRTATR